jgi:hypothetical protein
MDLAERQARMGIIANPAKVALPPVVPREILTRWPDLRSKRRLRKRGQLQVATPDASLQDDVLTGLRDDIRKRSISPKDWLAQFPVIFGAR